MEGVADGDAFGDGLGLGESVFDPEGIGGHFPAVGLDEVDAFGYKGAVGVVERPRELDNAGPVINVGDGCFVIFWKSGGFGVKYEEHGACEAELLDVWMLICGMGWVSKQFLYSFY